MNGVSESERAGEEDNLSISVQPWELWKKHRDKWKINKQNKTIYTS